MFFFGNDQKLKSDFITIWSLSMVDLPFSPVVVNPMFSQFVVNFKPGDIDVQRVDILHKVQEDFLSGLGHPGRSSIEPTLVKENGIIFVVTNNMIVKMKSYIYNILQLWFNTRRIKPYSTEQPSSSGFWPGKVCEVIQQNGDHRVICAHAVILTGLSNYSDYEYISCILVHNLVIKPLHSLTEKLCCCKNLFQEPLLLQQLREKIK